MLMRYSFQRLTPEQNFTGSIQRFGYRRLHALVRREGFVANHKKVYRLYSAAELAVRRRRKRKGVAVEREALALPSRPNEV